MFDSGQERSQWIESGNVTLFDVYFTVVDDVALHIIGMNALNKDVRHASQGQGPPPSPLFPLFPLPPPSFFLPLSFSTPRAYVA